MKQSKWRKYLTGEIDAKKLNQKTRAQLVYKVNKRAVQCLNDLILIFDGMHRISTHPDKQFRKIFLSNGAILRRFWTQIGKAHSDAFLSYSVAKLMVELMKEGIDFEPKRLVVDGQYRHELMAELLEKQIQKAVSKRELNLGASE